MASKPSAITFEYKGKDSKGSKKQGEIEASTLLLAKAELRRMGITPSSVKKKRQARISVKKVRFEDITGFSRQLATMMTAGVPLVQGLDIVIKGSDHNGVQKLANEIKYEVESGKSFSEALTKHPDHFDELYCNLVAAGEASGSLETMLSRIAEYQEKTESLRRKIKKALVYPTAVVCVALIVTSILLLYVVPKFDDMFGNFGADLPAFTRMVIDLSEFMQKWWFILFSALAFGIFSFMRALKKKGFRRKFDAFMLKAPVVGNIVEQAAIARYARTLATTFAAGVPLTDALTSVAGATGNMVFGEAILRIREEVSVGTQMQQAMRQSSLFPNMVVQMIAIGEESGSLDDMLNKVADIYEEKVDIAVDGLSSLMEPIIMAILGVLVGGLVVAMYLPVFQMGSVV